MSGGGAEGNRPKSLIGGHFMRGMGLHMGLSRSTPRPSLSHYSASSPLYIAHRGSGLRYPEYSLESFAAAYSGGLRVLEFDCQLTSDGALAVMHNPTVDATTTSTGNVSALTAAQFKALTIDASVWHGWSGGDVSPCLASEVIPIYAGRVIFVPEAKVAGSCELLVAELQAAGVGPDQALIQSFLTTEIAVAVAAGYPALLLLSDATATTPEDVIATGATWVGMGQTEADATIESYTASALNVALYTIVRRYERDRALALGATALICDDPAYIAASGALALQDDFASQTWMAGMVGNLGEYGADGRGRFVAPDQWGWATDAAGQRYMLQGWAGKIGTPATIDFKIQFNAGTGWASVFVADDSMDDRRFTNGADAEQNGYHFLFRKNGNVQIYRTTAGVATLIGTAAGTVTAISDGAEATYRITITDTHVASERLDVPNSVSVADTTYRGGHLHTGHNGAAVLFRDITIS